MKFFADNSPLRRSNWLLTSTLAGLTVLYLSVAYFPARKAMTVMSAELQLKRQKVMAAALLAQEIATTRDQLTSAERYVRQQREVAGISASAVLFGDISAIASTAGVRTTRFEPAPGIQTEQLLQLPLSIACTGSFPQIFALVQGLEQLPQAIWIEELRIEKKRAEGDELNCQLKLAAFSDKSNISD
jgi:Tfp pilus assembly protein PilO